jgi:hypothetical protein
MFSASLGFMNAMNCRSVRFLLVGFIRSDNLSPYPTHDTSWAFLNSTFHACNNSVDIFMYSSPFLKHFLCTHSCIHYLCPRHMSWADGRTLWAVYVSCNVEVCNLMLSHRLSEHKISLLESNSERWWTIMVETAANKMKTSPQIAVQIPMHGHTSP